MKTLICAFAALMFSVIPARAPAQTLIKNDLGGLIQVYMDKYEALRASGDTVKVDGYCDSACTLVTAYIPAHRICVTRKTTFGFHSAYTMDGKVEVYSRAATQDMWDRFPKEVRAQVRKAGWDGVSKHPEIVDVAGTKLYRVCRGRG